MDAKTRAELAELVSRWRALLQESLPFLARFEASLRESHGEATPEPNERSEVVAPRLASNEELLIALLQSFDRREASSPPADESDDADEATDAVAPVVEAGTPPQKEAQESASILPPANLDDDAPVVLVSRHGLWSAFPWDALEQVSANEAGSELGAEERYHLVYRVDGEERVLAVAEVGRILTRREARDLGIEHEWVLPEGGAELAELRLLAAPPAPTPAPTLPQPIVPEPEAEAPVEPTVEASAGAEPPEEEPLLSWEPAVRLDPVLVLELDASHTNGTVHDDGPNPVESEVAVVAVRYLPARVALARALRLTGWTVREEADPTEGLARLHASRPGLLCLELSEDDEDGGETAREFVRGGTQVFLVASRHRVVDPASLSDLPRILHPFTEGELARLPQPARVGPAA